MTGGHAMSAQPLGGRQSGNAAGNASPHVSQIPKQVRGKELDDHCLCHSGLREAWFGNPTKRGGVSVRHLIRSTIRWGWRAVDGPV